MPLESNICDKGDSIQNKIGSTKKVCSILLFLVFTFLAGLFKLSENSL